MKLLLLTSGAYLIIFFFIPVNSQNCDKIHMENYGYSYSRRTYFVIQCTGRRNISIDSNFCYDDTRCEELRILNSNITQIKSKAFVFIKQIQRIFMNSCGVKNIAPGAFFGLTSLTAIYLERNEINEISVGCFNSLTKLEVLVLSRNSIERIESESFHGSTAIKYLDLSFNELVVIPKKLFDPLSLLQIVNISNNFLQSLNGNLQTLQYLGNIVLNNNNLTEVNDDLRWKPLVNLTLANNSLKALRTLPSTLHKADFSSNRITEITSEIFKISISLKSLNLSHNYIKSIPYETFNLLTNLEIIKVSNNSINDLKAFSKLHALVIFDISFNEVTSIPLRVMENLTNLSSFNISWNKIKYLEAGVFNNLNNLSILDLSHNQLKLFRPEIYSHLKSLRFLSLSFNQIEPFDFKLLTGLNKIIFDIEGNYFSCEQLHELNSNRAVVLKRGNHFETENFNGISCSNKLTYNKSISVERISENLSPQVSIDKILNNIVYLQNETLTVLNRSLMEIIQRLSTEKIATQNNELVHLAGTLRKVDDELNTFIQNKNRNETGIVESNYRDFNTSFSKISQELSRISENFERNRFDENSIGVKSERIHYDNDQSLTDKIRAINEKTDNLVSGFNNLKLFFVFVCIISFIIASIVLYRKVKTNYYESYHIDRTSSELPMLNSQVFES